MKESEKQKFESLVKVAMESLSTFDRIDKFDMNLDGNEDLKKLSISELREMWNSAERAYDRASGYLAEFVAQFKEDLDFDEYQKEYVSTYESEDMKQLYEDVMVDACETVKYYY